MGFDFTVSVLASSANLGPGFDSFGIGLNLRNDFRFSASEEFSASSSGAYQLDNGWEENMVISVYLELCARAGLDEKKFRLESVNRIPFQSGLGSSATAILAGVAAFRKIHGLSLDRLNILADAIYFEPHPDNLAAALYGGLTVAYVSESEELPIVYNTKLGGKPNCLIIYPHQRVSTVESRKALKTEIPLSEAVKSIARASVLSLALCEGRYEYLFDSMLDTIHEPFRMNPDAEYPVLKEKLKSENFYGWAISGSGPSVIAFCKDQNDRVKTLIREHLKSRRIEFDFFDLEPDYGGLTILDN